MRKLSFVCTQEIYNTLSGLAYRIADNAYMIERFGREDASIELGQNHKTIISLFDKLDALHVPFWVQNAVMSWAEDWRRYKTGYVYQAFEKYQALPDDFMIDLSAVCNF